LPAVAHASPHPTPALLRRSNITVVKRRRKNTVYASLLIYGHKNRWAIRASFPEAFAHCRHPLLEIELRRIGLTQTI
jgi:hypothetical protein